MSWSKTEMTPLTTVSYCFVGVPGKSWYSPPPLVKTTDAIFKVSASFYSCATSPPLFALP